MTRGISVEMAKTANATAMPEADHEDAWVVTIRRDEGLHFGTEMVSVESLPEIMKQTPRNRSANLYIKADARVPFSRVEKVLQIARNAGFHAPVLLTKQPDVPALGKLVAPKGLQVFLGDPTHDAVSVEVTRSAQYAPEVMVNDQPVHLSDLQSALNQALRNQKERFVVLKVDGQLPFAQVAQIIDAGTSLQAKVVVSTPTF